MRTLRTARRGSLLGCLLVALGATGAGATTFCVQDPACPAGAAGAPSIQAAIAAAAALSGPDRIQIGPGTFDEGNLTAAGGNIVEIVGAGSDKTTIAPTTSSVTTLRLDDPAATVSDLTLRLGLGGGNLGLVLAGTAHRVAVTSLPGSVGTGVGLSGLGTFADGSVTLPMAGGTIGVTGAQGTLEHADVTAATGTASVGHVRRVRVSATTAGITAVATTFRAATVVDDALVRLLGNGPGIGLLARHTSVVFGSTAALTARHVTVIGNGAAGSIGIEVDASGGAMALADASATALVSSAILRQLGTDLRRTATGGGDSTSPASANLTIDDSDYDPAKLVSQNTTGAGSLGGAASGSIVPGAHVFNLDPRFRDAGGGDFALAGGSPMIDRGSSAPPAPDEPTVDLAGNPRVGDGDGDGIAVADIGAFEYRIPPSGDGGAAGPDGSTPSPRPILSALSLTHARFAVDRGATARTARRSAHRRKPLPRGTTIRFDLTPAATVQLTVARTAPGMRAHGRCVKPTARLRGAGAKRCSRHVTAFVFARSGRAGSNSVAFSGRTARGAALAPGAYRMTAIATADGVASKPHTARFTILRR